MVSPMADNYSVASGETLFAGMRPPLPYALPAAGELKSIHLNSLSSVDPCPSNTCWYSEDDGINAPWVAWCTSIFMRAASAFGKKRVWGGGHGAGDAITFTDFDFTTGLYERNGVENPAGDFTESLDATWCDALISGQPVPPASHTYNLAVALEPGTPGVGAEGGYALPFNVFGPNGQGISGNAQPHFATAAGVWGRLTTNTLSLAGTIGGGAFVDRKRNVLWLCPFVESNANAKIDLTQASKTLVSVTSFYGGGYYCRYVNCPNEDFTLVMWCDSGQTRVKYKLLNMSSGTPVHQGPTVVGTLDLAGGPGFGVDWCPRTKKFYLYEGRGATTVHTLTPPADPADWTTGNWTWGTETMTGETPVSALEHTPAAQGAVALGHWEWISTNQRFAWWQGACERESPDGVMRDGAVQLWCPAGVT